MQNLIKDITSNRPFILKCCDDNYICMCLDKVLYFISFFTFRNLDDIFQIKTRNVVCHPLRANRGGGRVIGVLEMANKLNGQDFEASDVDILADCARKVSDEVHIRFRELLQAAEMLQGKSELIGERSGANHRFDAPTASSLSGQYLGSTKHVDPAAFFMPKFSTNSQNERDVALSREKLDRRKSFSEDLTL